VLGAGEALVGAMLLVMMGVATLSIPSMEHPGCAMGEETQLLSGNYVARHLHDRSRRGWDPRTSLVALYVLLGVTGLGFGAQQVLPFAMLTDVIHHDVAGREGVTTGFWVANEKLGLALGPLVAGLILQLCGFREGPIEHNLAASKRHCRVFALPSRSYQGCCSLTSALLLTRCRNPQPAPRVVHEAGWNVTEETATPPLLERISDYLTLVRAETPRAEALVLGTQRMTYQQLAHDVDSLSCALIAAGIRSGDRIATLATPHPDFFIVLLAASSIGAIWVGLNPRYRAGGTHLRIERQPSDVDIY
jgi:MFS family permease